MKGNCLNVRMFEYSIVRQLVSLTVAIGLFCLGATLSFAQEQVQTRVSILSQPPGATVIVDGQDRGVTPIMLFDLTPGRHHIKYRLAGYQERDRFVDTREAPSIEKNEVLQETKGLLLVRSDPPGAAIVVDGESRGQTPRLITDLAAKDEHLVKLRKPGYLEQTLKLKFNGREPKVVDEKLVLDSGVVDVISEPSGAEVTINGISRGKTPLTVSGIPKGRATIKFVQEGFDDEIRELAMRAGDRQTLSVVMQAKPGTLHLVSVPEGARFYLNDEARGLGPLVIPGLKPGDYTVRAEKPGFGTITKTVTISNGAAAREEFRLSNVMGRLEIRTDPVGAQVLFDGRLLGATKAQVSDAEYSDVFPIEAVLEGEHVLVVRKNGYAEATRHPKVVNSQTTTANVRLKRIFVPDVEIVTDRGTYPGILVSNDPESVTIEVSLGITRSFPRAEIRKINFLAKKK